MNENKAKHPRDADPVRVIVGMVATVMVLAFTIWLVRYAAYIFYPHPNIPTHTPTPTTTDMPTNTPLPPTETPVSTGRLEVTYPLEMIVEEADVVTVEIIADPKYAEVGVHPSHATGVITIETSGGRVRIEDRIRLYPVMSAELVAANFDIVQGDADARRAITTTYCAAWTWSVAARKPGIQKITINIFGETTIDGEKLTVLEASKSQNIEVMEKPLPKRILDGLASNFVAIVGTGGPLGLIIAYLTFRANQANKELKDKIEKLEDKLEKLEGKETTEGES